MRADPRTRRFRPTAERLEAREVPSAASTAAAVGTILRGAGTAPLRPNTPVAPLESPAATATFLDPSTRIVGGDRIRVGRRDYVAPFATLDVTRGFIRVGSSSAIGDNASLVANPGRSRIPTGILVGDNVSIAPGATIRGPATVGATGGAATTIGPNAVIDGATIRAGASVGALARVGPGVTIEAGFRVLPGANVTNQAEATDPSLGQVAASEPGDAATASALVARGQALAAAYANLYQGQSATGTGSGGPVPAALGSTVFLGALNNVLGASPEPGARFAPFEPASGSPTFLGGDGTPAALAPNRAYRFPARVVGRVEFAQSAAAARRALGRRDSIRGDEGQPITFAGPIGALGDGVTIHSPLGGVRTTTTTTVTTSLITNGIPTITTTTATVTTMAAPTATPRTTVATTAGTDAAGRTTSGTVTTTVAVATALVGGIDLGAGFRAGDGATILGGPSRATTFGDGVAVGAGAVVATSDLGAGVVVGDRAYVADSTIAAGAVIPPGAIYIDGTYRGQVRS